MNDEETQVEPEAEVDDPTPSPDNLMEAFRARRKEVGEDTELWLDVLEVEEPPMALVGQYRRLEVDELTKIARRVQRSKAPDREFMAQVDTVASALVEMWVRMKDPADPTKKKLIKLRDIIPGRDEPVRYDNALGTFLGFDPEGSARRAVLATFNNELAVTPHHNELSSWMQSTRPKEEEDFNES